MSNIEIEARFLDINKEKLIDSLHKVGAIDCGEELLEEVIFYDKDFKWRDVEHKFIRLRKNNKKVVLTYKQHITHTVDGSEEIEFEIESLEKGINFLNKIDLLEARHQEKKRHTFTFNDVTIDIDTWPRIPTYVELEADSEEKIKETAILLGFDWNKANFENAGYIIENRYHIPVLSLKWFTFDKFE